MLTVETSLTTEILEDGTEKKEPFFIINGIKDEDSYIISNLGCPNGSFRNKEVIDILTHQSFQSLGEHFSVIFFDLEVDWWMNEIRTTVYCNKYVEQIPFPSMFLDFHIQEWWNWTKPWSAASLAKEIERRINNLGNEKIKYHQEEDTLLNGFGFVYELADDSLIVKEELEYLLKDLKLIFADSTKYLRESLDPEAVLTYFQFPDDVKTACKQYLVYFTQFIADMGIAIDIELRDELNHTLFKVIPTTKNESLANIRDALDIYLKLPNSNEFQNEISNQSDIAAKQWEANIYHLKSQLSLASSIIQAKDSTIEMLQLSNYQYRQLLNSRSTESGSQNEELIKGIISVKKYDGKGFSIDFPELFRRLKRKFKK